MLILTFKDGESFEIGNDVKVWVLNRRANQTRIGIEAPKSIGVHRAKIADRIRAENDGTIPGREVE